MESIASKNHGKFAQNIQIRKFEICKIYLVCDKMKIECIK